MQNHSDVVISTRGQALQYASVQVLTYPALTVATIYGDNSSTIKGNPTLTAADGSFSFWAADGTYVLQTSYGGVTTTSDPLILFDNTAATGAASVDSSTGGSVEARLVALEAGTATARGTYLNALDYGIKGDGVTDDTNACIAFLQLGGALWFPVANYLIKRIGPDSGGVYATITKSLCVMCSPGARFFTDGLDNDFFHLSVPSNGSGLDPEGITVEWYGGLIDQVNQRTSTSVPFPVEYPARVGNQGTSATTSGLTVTGSYNDGSGLKNGIKLFHVSRLTVYSGVHWQVSGGDQAIVPGDGTDLAIIENCVLISNRDQGVYATREGTGTAGGRVILRKNTFINCFGGTAVKRSISGFSIDDNDFINCVIGVLVSQIVGPGCEDGSIGINRFKNCQVNVRMDLPTNVHVWHNMGKDFGAYLADGVTPVTAYTPVGYWIRGATNCRVVGNVSLGVTAAYAAGNPGHLNVESFNPGSGAVSSTQNDILDNVSDGFHSPGSEAAGEADFNRCEHNSEISGAVKDFIITGASSSNERYTYSTGRKAFMTPVNFDDGSAATPIIARRSGTSTGLYLGANLVGVTISGTERLEVNAGGIKVVGTVQGAVGTAAGPIYSFTSETTMGMYRKATGKLGFSTASTERFYIDSQGITQLPPPSITPANNGEMIWQLTNDTTLVVKVKGSDAVVRSATLTLA